MNRRFRDLRQIFAAVIGGLCLAVLGAGVATAQFSEQGVLNAVSYADLPAGQPITVQPLDNSDENLEIQAEFERELAAHGYTVQPGSPLVLTFETEDRIGSWSEGNRRTILELEGSGAPIGQDDAKARLNLFDSERGGIMNRGQGGRSAVNPSTYRLNVTIDDNGRGERLWHGWATADLQQSSGTALTRAMVPSLVQHLGQTVRSQPFDLW